MAAVAEAATAAAHRAQEQDEQHHWTSPEGGEDESDRARAGLEGADDYAVAIGGHPAAEMIGAMESSF